MIYNRAAMEHYVVSFKRFVEDWAHGDPFTTFENCGFIQETEAYKDRVYANARQEITPYKWKTNDIGKGKIAFGAVRAMRKSANLVHRFQRTRFEELSKVDVFEFESVLYEIYCGDDPESAFSAAVRLFGGNYDLIAYLFFLRDKTRFLPISPGHFDFAFSKLGINLKTSRMCSWNNYMEFVAAVREVRGALGSILEGSEPTLLDAHSFLFTISYEPDIVGDAKNCSEFDSSSPRKKDILVISRARIGQGDFRSNLMEFWGGRCAVTGCSDERVLVASHIKPWVDCNQDNEWLNPHNGLLLCAAYDSAFDAGLITFDDVGCLMVSKLVEKSNLVLSGIDLDAKLRRVDEEHKVFLAYHRGHVFLR